MTRGAALWMIESSRRERRATAERTRGTGAQTLPTRAGAASTRAVLYKLLLQSS